MTKKTWILTPCPFCNGDPNNIREGDLSLICGTCGCEGRHGLPDECGTIPLLKKINAWNKRPKLT